MAHSVHVITKISPKAPVITVRDDAGATVTELASPSDTADTDTVDRQLQEAGWVRNGVWSSTDDGWTAPVTAS